MLQLMTEQINNRMFSCFSLNGKKIMFSLVSIIVKNVNNCHHLLKSKLFGLICHSFIHTKLKKTSFWLLYKCSS